MLAVNYQGPFKVKVESVPMPKIEDPNDIIVKITTSAICGSDLHMYEGRTGAQPGITFGHENMGIVESCGSGIKLTKPGDRVVMPFNVADGTCNRCLSTQTAFCTGVNPGFAGGAYGYVAMGLFRVLPGFNCPELTIAIPGPYRGGQAQYIRIPFGDFNALVLPPGTDNEADFILLADIFPTGWHAVSLSGFQPGETVGVWGAGPVGLMAAYSALLRGSSRVFVIDRVPERLAAAKKIGCTPIDFTKGDAVQQILEQNGKELDRAVDAVGYQAVDNSGSKEQPNIVLEQMIKAVRACGGLGIPGLSLNQHMCGSNIVLTVARSLCSHRSRCPG